jgi:uncharacterized damage-inducible protein DinB
MSSEPNQLETFLKIWNREAEKTIGLLRALPEDSYDFRPDAGGRSVGELAWHLAEGDAYISYGIANGRFALNERPSGIERPRSIAALAPGYERVHRESVARVETLTLADLGRTLAFFDGRDHTVGELLWEAILFHHIHHRGQLSTLCRQARGTSPGMFGPNREEMVAVRARLAAEAEAAATVQA